MKYILSVDQSTQGTKGLLFDENGILTERADRPHAQLINDRGWVEHDPVEILKNTLAVCRDVVEKAAVSTKDILAFGISNQRENGSSLEPQDGRACSILRLSGSAPGRRRSANGTGAKRR